MLLIAMILVIPSLVMVLICVSLHVGFKTNPKNKVGTVGSDALVPATIVFAISLVVSSIVSIQMLVNTVGSARDLESFYYDNAALFQEATAEIKEGVEPSHALFFDSARMNHITVYAGQVREYQKNAVVFNKDLRRHKYWQEHPLFSVIYADVDPDVQSLPILGFRSK